MFGKNPIRPPEKGDGTSLKVQSIFLTIQGEGPYTGHPALFIRLGGCNLACSFCDTEFEEFTEKTVEEIVEQAKNLTRETKCSLVVITGGEPFRQPIGLLCKELIAQKFKIQIESNGTLYQEIPDEVEVVCSPKIVNGKYHIIRNDVEKHIVAYKFLVSKSLNGYDNIPDWQFDKKVFVQPIDEYDEIKNVENNKLAMEIATRTGYIFSVQIHKFVGIE